MSYFVQFIHLENTQGGASFAPLGGRKGDQRTGGANPIVVIVVNIPKVNIQTEVDNLHERLS